MYEEGDDRYVMTTVRTGRLTIMPYMDRLWVAESVFRVVFLNADCVTAVFVSLAS